MSFRSGSDHIDTRNPNNPASPVNGSFLHDRASTDFSPLRGRYDEYDYRDDDNDGDDGNYIDQAEDRRRPPKLGLAISGVRAHLPAQHHRRTSSGVSLPRKPVGSQSSPRTPWTPKMSASSSQEPLLSPTSPPPPAIALPRGLRFGVRDQSPGSMDTGTDRRRPPSGGGGGIPVPSYRDQSPDSLARKLLGGECTNPRPFALSIT